MRVADVVRGVSEHIRHARRAAGDIRYVGIFLHDFFQVVIEKRFRHVDISREKHPVDGHRLNLVIAAEQRKRRVEMQTFHLIFRFLFYVFHKRGQEKGISLTRKREVLPHKDTALVALVIEKLVFVSAPAEYSYHIHIHKFDVGKQTAAFFPGENVRNVGRDVIRALYEKGHTV